jgi:hypothetical protein
LRYVSAEDRFLNFAPVPSFDSEGPQSGRLDPFSARLAVTASCAQQPAGFDVKRLLQITEVMRLD